MRSLPVMQSAMARVLQDVTISARSAPRLTQTDRCSGSSQLKLFSLTMLASRALLGLQEGPVQYCRARRLVTHKNSARSVARMHFFISFRTVVYSPGCRLSRILLQS